ncbi:MAG: penicillin acylase family protein [Hyphomicrobiales bacterium]|nr:penicillin acylase family protein [Hyphomicrobiales bacterium]
MQREDIEIDGLGKPAEIAIDRWGIPHIRAENLDDLFFAQGFAVARDRLWQIDLWRKKGLGLLAADFGPGFLAQDYASRLFLYRGDMEKEWAAYAPDAKAICRAFAEGVNAYVDLIDRQPERLPPEFAALDTWPAKWRAADIVRIRSHAVGQNAISEILRSNVLAGADAATDLLRKALRPKIEPRNDPAIGAVPLAALEFYRLATAHPTFTKERLAATMDEAWDWSGVDDANEVVRRADAKPPVPIEEGSNNWAIAPRRSATGRPIVCNDPHRVLRNPSLRYLSHLTAPGFDAIGANEPFLPGVSVGHNGQVAFGLTIFYIDQEDVYVYETSADGRSYKYRDGYEQIRRLTERFEARGASPRDLTLKFTRHGPVVYETPGRAVAIRSVWFEPGSAPYGRALTTMRAKNLDEFREGVRCWGTPSVNHVCGDVAGRIGWAPSGFCPIRANWDGLTPARGDGAHEWAGFLDAEQLPRLIDPDVGYVASANEMNLPPDFPHRVGYEWIDYARISRIREAIEAQEKFDVARSCALQTDLSSHPARKLMALAREVRADGPAAAALALLSDWDCRVAADSAACALYEIWWTHHLRLALLAHFAPDPAVRALLPPGEMSTLIEALETLEADTRAEMMRVSLAAAWAEAEAKLGDDPAAWSWGALHKMRFSHALAQVDPTFPPAAPDLPMGGDGTNPMMMLYRPANFDVMIGASARLVMDVGAWDESRCINAPGQSGDPRSPHYGDLAPLWARGEYVPLLYSRAAVDAATERLIALRPAARA